MRRDVVIGDLYFRYEGETDPVTRRRTIYVACYRAVPEAAVPEAAGQDVAVPASEPAPQGGAGYDIEPGRAAQRSRAATPRFTLTLLNRTRYDGVL